MNKRIAMMKRKEEEARAREEEKKKMKLIELKKKKMLLAKLEDEVRGLAESVGEEAVDTRKAHDAKNR